MKKQRVFIIYPLFLLLLFQAGCDIFNLNGDDFDYGEAFSILPGETLYENRRVSVTFDSCELAYNDVSEDSLKYYSRMQFTVSILGRDTLITFDYGSQWYCRDLFGFEPGYIYSFCVDSLKEESSEFRAYCVLDRVDEQSMVDKPNIYLYPEDTLQASVSLAFPRGGHVVISDPVYPDAWQNITLTPDGLIDDGYEFLFYEAEIGAAWQYKYGWNIRRRELPQFFRNTLRVYGLNDEEIEDFMDYWLKRLTEAEYYTVYPQKNAQIDPLISLEVSPEPETLFRLYYIFREGKTPFWKLRTPKMRSFERKGFTVVEWGGSVIR